ncbi:MAG: glutamine-hydrolyzing GMP synthase [Candidatus Cloacimonetes bacterium]|nr:glutamine-hydrolyzing GMP synthase [Candidatus Cloacimonadota bacterium]
MHNKVLILDFGSQYTQLIARTIRSQNVYCEIHPYLMDAESINDFAASAIILSGSPFSITNKNAPHPNQAIWNLGIPILGICYGMQLISANWGGEVHAALKREYGFAELYVSDSKDVLFDGLKQTEQVWMSHGDALSKLPECFDILAKTDNSPHAAIKHKTQPIYALQFHPEVVHTPCGKKIIANFLFRIAGLKADWTPGSFISESIKLIRDKVGEKKVILGLSGGVDSTVAAMLLYKAIGNQLIPIFVDTGLMRYNEANRVKELFASYPDLNIRYVDAGTSFLSKLKDVSDPEQKRKIIGSEFINVFDKVAKEYSDAEFLAQGTLYPDVIESVSFAGPSATIKSHHNVGGLPDKMKLKLVEPLRELFKDEVREVGASLGLPDSLVQRHPFPGPGLAVRIIGAVDIHKVQLLQQVDDIFISELYSSDLYNKTWQAFAVLLPVHSVGVMGDERTYDQVCALRAVNSIDGMTADWTELPHSFLKRVSNRISNEVKGISRVVFDISSKPPSTIEWE